MRTKWGLTKTCLHGIIHKHSGSAPQYRGVEQLEARRAHNPEVVGSSPASATIKEPGIDTKSVPGLFFFIRTFTPKRGVFLTLQRILISVAKMLCFYPPARSMNPYILRFQFVKIPQFVILPRYSLIYWTIRYTTEFTEKEPVYLVNLATCILLAAELTSHPHLGGDDNATTFGATETVRREPHI